LPEQRTGAKGLSKERRRMSSTTPVCRAIQVLAFVGDRSRSFAAAFLKALDDEKNGRGPGPTVLACQLFAGHAGVSTDGGSTFYGFSPDGAGLPIWQVMDRLKHGHSFPGVVRDDSAVFSAAQRHGLSYSSFEVLLPDPTFQNFQGTLDGEKRKSQYSYGFPNGDGDCNCVTWLERLGLPLLTGRMNEFVGLAGASSNPSRRFGRCS
jgi:hypothetical protein